eukprot:evm.model.scf_291.11 EVM.evm.TU.scf_291.11   scf_291:99395-99907(+)
MGKGAMRDYHSVNNYHRAEGQNVGNFITDRPSSRVLAPPGGGSQVSLSMDAANAPAAAAAAAPAPAPAPAPPPKRATPPARAAKPVSVAPPPAPTTPPPAVAAVPIAADNAQSAGDDSDMKVDAIGCDAAATTNNYARPDGMQNVGNFITERSSSRVIAPPGGTSNVILG